ncbi:hypothetical protein OC00_05450 [Xanthomonas vasicola]|nr:hypothetical protein NX07_12125 [Xanthomonas vasicola]KGR54255.1 hypothetical protein NX09_13145 [Xanthomonas vasicola]KGT84975.1 hypothetical protein OC00_05450 [Xanthomonas vasicola]
MTNKPSWNSPAISMLDDLFKPQVTFAKFYFLPEIQELFSSLIAPSDYCKYSFYYRDSCDTSQYHDRHYIPTFQGFYY